MLPQTIKLYASSSESGRLIASNLNSSATSYNLCICEQNEGFSAADQIRAFLSELLGSQYSEAFETMLSSENVLRKDWDTPEEDKAWANL